MRSYGETDNCNGCRFWSEMIAQSIGGGPVQALCLSQDGPLSLRQLRERIQNGGQVDMFDIGGCGCFVEDQA